MKNDPITEWFWLGFACIRSHTLWSNSKLSTLQLNVCYCFIGAKQNASRCKFSCVDVDVTIQCLRLRSSIFPVEQPIATKGHVFKMHFVSYDGPSSAHKFTQMSNRIWWKKRQIHYISVSQWCGMRYVVCSRTLWLARDMFWNTEKTLKFVYGRKRYTTTMSKDENDGRNQTPEMSCDDSMTFSTMNALDSLLTRMNKKICFVVEKSPEFAYPWRTEEIKRNDLRRLRWRLTVMRWSNDKQQIQSQCVNDPFNESEAKIKFCTRAHTHQLIVKCEMNKLTVLCLILFYYHVQSIQNCYRNSISAKQKRSKVLQNVSKSCTHCSMTCTRYHFRSQTDRVATNAQYTGAPHSQIQIECTYILKFHTSHTAERTEHTWTFRPILAFASWE